jgi:hypothetical protein
VSRKSSILSIASVLALTLACAPAMAATVFSDNFESGLGQWTGKGSGATSGQIVLDPLNQSNHVLNFTAVVIGGDIFSSQPFYVGTAQTTYLSFDFLGLAVTGGAPQDSGGFAGYSQGTPDNHHWLAGTELAYVDAGNTQLIDDGTWHHYVIPFTSAFPTIRVMLEDFAYAGPIAGDAYFDNIKVVGVPLPSAAWGGLSLLGGLVAFARRSRA